LVFFLRDLAMIVIFLLWLWVTLVNFTVRARTELGSLRWDTHSTLAHRQRMSLLMAIVWQVIWTVMAGGLLWLLW
jgi:hypothetical protein